MAVKPQIDVPRFSPTRGAAHPVAEPGIFTGELGAPQILPCEDQTAFFGRVRSGIVARQTGARTSPLRATVSFESLAVFRAVVTPQRARLVDTVNQLGPFESIQALSRALHRDRGTVSKDAKALAAVGLLRVQRTSASGASKRVESALAGNLYAAHLVEGWLNAR